ncbi:MAG: sugar porter family MFS transporter [Planctomycetes bacterium]|nr:sugar porter family MFS transporter [Planctomycetota bacterium]MBU4399265.1 sugar porter family MFS transporter [Planctomycetota bacterium]MCG2682878.1 sugar porter family MFS transporter [Planctomycetales bacterium]
MTTIIRADAPDALAGAAGRGSALFLGLVCLVASIGGLLFGFDTAVISGTFGFIEAQYGLNKLEVGWFGSSALVGCLLGAAVAGTLTDRFGRKPVLIAAAAFFFLCALGCAIAPSFTAIVAARIVGGLGVGMASVLAPMYISEFSPPRLRGRLVALYQLSIVLGILAAYFSNWLLLGFAQGHADAFGSAGWLHRTLVAEVWRGMFGVGMVPAAVFFLLLFVVPESPRWLLKVGKDALALQILARVSGVDTARKEVGEIQEALLHDGASVVELFKPGLRMALMVALALSIFGQMTGVNIVVYYGPTILEAAGFTLGNAMQYQVALGVINFIFTLIAIWKIDSWGRRPLLIWGLAVVTLAMAGTAILLLKGAPALWIVLLLCIYMACEALSICAVIWVLTAEIFPNRIRGRAMSITIFANWATNALTAFFFPWYVERFGMHAGFFSFAAVCFVATLFFWKFVPETKGRSLEEIERHWLA